MPHFRWLGILLLMLTFATVTAAAQLPGHPNTQPESQAELDHDMQQKLRLEQQKKRFEQMKHDSQRLLELATELKKYVDQSGEHVLSMEVVRKAEEMERLARRVKDNMRGN